MNKFLCYKAKKVVSIIVAVAIMVSLLSDISVLAEKQDDTYPYTMFAASDEDGGS